ncbi:DUF748 domain-containing protein [Ideonella sp. DXS22W]|uniref:DUF748 domain-containing protein n=1 Tax=Pseudaquabacterium inlustre TaxID=2984192 RepID=A0ABU9CC82_9BURK
MSDAPDVTAPAAARAGRWPRRLAVLGLVLLVLAALVTWALPPALSAVLRHELPPRLGALLGRPVSVGAVQVQPWQLALQIEQLRIGAAPGQGDEPQLALGRVALTLSAASLRHGAPVVSALSVQSPRLRLTRTAPGRLDIDDILQRLAQRPTDATGDQAPARFALYNLRLDEGQVTLTDQVVGRSHRIEALSLALPFLSNLPAHVAIHTQPRLSLRLDGTPITSTGQALPFAQTREAALNLQLDALDLAPWLAYQPASLPLRLASGRLAARLSLDFRQAPAGRPSVSLRGTLQLDDVAVQGRDGSPLAAWQQLALELRDVQPLAQRVALGTLRIDAPQLTLSRARDGRLNWQRLLATPTTPTTTATTTAADAAGAVPPPPAPSADARPWQLTLDALQLNDGTVDWHDATQAGARLQLARLALRAGPLYWPAAAPAPLTLTTTLQRDGQALGQLSLDARASPREAGATLTATGVSLAAAAPYLTPMLVPTLQGRLTAEARLDWAGGDAAPRLAVHLPTAQLDDLALRPPGGAPAAGWRRLQLQDLRLDLLARRATVGRVAVEAPRLNLERQADGRLNLAQWLRPAAAPTTATTTAARATASPSRQPDWQLALDEFAIDGGRLRFTDQTVDDQPGTPLQAEASQLRLRLRQLRWPATPRQAPMPVQLDLRLGVPMAAAATGERAGANAPPAGEWHWSGRLGLAPLLAEGRLRARRLPLQLAERYAGDAMGPLTLLRAEGGLDGRLALRQQADGWHLATTADARIDELQLHTRPEAGGRLDAASELLSWQSLALTGLQFSLAPGARPRLALQEATLSDFYSRLVITEDGRFNLRDAAARPAEGAPAPAPAAAAASTPAAPPAAPADALPIDLAIGGTRLVNGRIDFTDRFIRPNYSARLSALNGQLGALRSDTREMAALALSGRAADTATLEISGQLNPTARPLALDIRAKASDLELAPLSPYAGKYAGYAIERGKLSMDVAYKIDPDGKLDARNQVILNQLTFGEAVDSPDATQLPVRLAIALLKDRHGVIDINLPISGSVDDPQFSVGGLIFKVVVNLLGKALTAPFSLLTGGQGPDISQVQFLPGVAEVAPAGQAVLDQVAQALLDRPGLQMTVAGAADPVSEREAWQAAALEARLQAEQRRALLRAAPATAPQATAAPASAPAASPPTPAAPPAPITGEARTRLLRELYRNTALPDRPRNLIGLLRELPPAEMEARLKAAMVVSTDVMRELALQRGLAVRDALVARGLPAERLFLAAPLLRASDAAEDGDAAAWVPRVKLTLALP